MNDSQPKVILTGIGILSKLAFLYYFSDEYGVDARVVKEMKKIGDLKKGIEIGSNVKLRVTSRGDTDSLAIYPTSIDSFMQYSLHDYVLESSLEVDDNSQEIGRASDRIRHSIRSAIVALRILKPGYVDANVILWVTTRGSDRDTSLMAEKTLRSHPFGDYRFGTNELPELIDLMKRISEIDFSKRKSLRIALDRFERSYDELENEDKLIDYMISFEALFLGGEKSREQHAVIPVACAMLLGQSEKERQEIRKLLGLAYRIRNRIVHGSDYEKVLTKHKLELEYLVTKVETILRASLRKLI